MLIPRIIISGPTSSVGKTMVTLGILYKLKSLGYKIQPFKVGPDFIDPSYHKFVTDRPSYNLDAWMMGKLGIISTFKRVTKDSDIAVIEGVMGLFDGADGKSDFASTAHIAKILDSPVILVLDTSKGARSIAAIAHGFINFDKKIKIVGIVLNKIAGRKHFTFIKDAFNNKIKVPIIGKIYRDEELCLNERHLGLVPTIELDNNRRKAVNNAAKIIAEQIDTDLIIKLLEPTDRLGSKITNKIVTKSERERKKDIKIAIALDGSFNFYYQENLNTLRDIGAELVFFSPLDDTKLPDDTNGVIIGGGFPEILSSKLNENQSMMKTIKKIGEDETPIYAECGGLMYLTKTINDNKFEKLDNYRNIITNKSNKTYKMVGLIDGSTVMTGKLILNYTKAEIINYSLFGKISSLRGHEFHYSKIIDISKDSKFSYNLKRGIGISDNKDGIMTHNVLASYMHIHFSNSKYPRGFIVACKKNLKK